MERKFAELLFKFDFASGKHLLSHAISNINLPLERAGRALKLITIDSKDEKMRKPAKTFEIESLETYKARVTQEKAESNQNNSAMEWSIQKARKATWMSAELQRINIEGGIVGKDIWADSKKIQIPQRENWSEI